MSARRLLASLSAAVLLPFVAVAAPAVAAPSSVDDVYRYLEDPGMTGEGQQPPHAMLRPYADARTAAADVTAHNARSPWVSSLNGDWRLTIADRPENVPAGFYADGYDVSGWPHASVPHTWQSDFTDHPMFRNIPEEVWPDDPPRVPRDVNPTGAYVRSFEVARGWADRRTFLRFEGVTSGYFVWVNGQYVGYDQGGYTPAEFDVTDALRPGTNRVAVQVHRWGAGSYLEDFDQWRYSGIFRDVWLYSTPRTYLRDAYITTDLDESYVDAVLTARVSVAGASDGYTVRGTLLDAAGRPVLAVTGRDTLTATVPNPRKWSADAPHLYALVLELLDADGRVTHTTAQAVGFREVEVRDKQMLVNGQRVLIKGTNRAETDPDTGRHVTRAAQRRDVQLMKSLHINAVRTSHYPSDPYLYDLANEHGLWIADEVDIETHSRENCPSNCLASRPEWQAAFADRFEAMVQRDKNHPSVIIWDTGNEAGLGTAHHAMAAWADAHEPTRLLYHQSNSPDGDAPYADVWGPRYPTPAYVDSIGRSTTRPVVFGEYAHAMGNSVGNFDRFWDLVRRYPSLQGGFIWDWAEANLNQPLVFTPDSSPHQIQTFLVGKPSVASGHLELSSLDDFVSTFRDPRLDFTGDAVKLDARVRPGEWAGSFPIVTKGQAYALQMRDRNTLEFGVTTVDGGWAAVAAPVPADWYGSWHQATGVYDGAFLKLSIDGVEVATAARTGALDPGLYEVNVGRNAATQQDDLRTRLARGSIDWVRISSGTSLALALEFERTFRRGEFASLGISLSGTDGLVGTDRYLQPETEEVAWAHAPVRFSLASPGTVSVHNEQPFGALAVTLRWSVLEVDRRLLGGSRPVRLAPGQTVTVDVGDLPPNPHDRQRWLRMEAVGADGLRYGWDEFASAGRVVPGVLLSPSSGAPLVRDRPGEIVVSGRGWNYRFDTATGTLNSMTADGKQLLRTGPQLDVYRPPTSNETYGWGTADREVWHDLGLDRLSPTLTGISSSMVDGSAVVEVRSVARGSAAFEIEQVMRYRIDAAGTITLDHRVTPRGAGASRLPYLPRVGVQIQVPASMQKFAYYGAGPHETYNDRTSGAFTGVWRSTVDEEYVRYSRPQAYGNHTGARWASLHDGRRGLVVGSPSTRNIDVSVTPYDELARAEYDFQLPLVRNKGWVTLHAAAGETGMGETPNSVIEEYRVSPTRTHEYSLVLRPLTATELRAGGVLNSRAAAPCPPDVALAPPAGGQIRPGEPFEVAVTVAARCAITDATATLAAPAGWTVTPASVDLGDISTSGRAVFTVTAPADTDFGVYDLAATVTARSGQFPVTMDAPATVRAPLPAGGVWVSDLPFVSTQNGWGPVERDMSNGEQPAGDGRTLSVGGVTYEKGIGAHAVSRVVVDLPEGCTSFRADVGVDDEMGASGSVGFEVWVDGALRASSAVLTGANGTERVTANVTGGQQLELRITDGGNGVGADHGDWAAARLLC